MSFFKPPVKYYITLQIHDTQLSSNIIHLGQKDSQSANFKIFECPDEVHKISHVIYETTNLFFFLSLHRSSV